MRYLPLAPLAGLTTLHFASIFVKCWAVRAVGGQKARSSKVSRLSKKTKTKKIPKRQFLDFNFNPQIYKFFKNQNYFITIN